MDKERIKAESAEFCSEGSGYIHSEMKDGKAPELVICGDFIAMMWQICGMIQRISDKTRNPFLTTVEMIARMPQMGYENIQMALKGTEPKHIDGEDWQEEWKTEKEKEIRREAQFDNIALAFNLAEMEKKNISLNNQLVDLKKDYQKKLKAKDEEIKKINKELLVTEHRLKEMEQQRMFPMGEDDD